MLKDVIERLNRVPEKNFIAFLEMLGVKLLPAHAAIAPITFKLTEGTNEPVLIPKRTQVAAGDVVFETDKNMVATPAKLVEVYSVDGENDAIYRCPSDVISGEAVVPFKGKLAYEAKTGENDIYLDNSEGLKEGDHIVIDKSESAIISKISENKATLRHELGKDYNSGSYIGKISNFELFKGKDLQEHILYLGHKELFNNIKGIDDIQFIEGLDDIQFPDNYLTCEYCSGQDQDTKALVWKELRFPLEKDMSIVEINGIKSRWIRCRVKTSQISNTQDIILKDFKLKIKHEQVPPDLGFYNDVPIDFELEDTIYPLGKLPRLYDTCYIASQEAFSKKDAEILITYTKTTDPGARDPIDPLPVLSWEYWNGESWIRIPGMMKYHKSLSEDDTEVTLPDDSYTSNFGLEQSLIQGTIAVAHWPKVKPITVNGKENLWIRIRLVGGDYGKETYVLEDGTAQSGGVIPPEISNLQINYDYIMVPQKIENAIIYNNQEFIDVTEELKDENKPLKPFTPLEESNQTLYLGFNQKLENGPISLFFSLEEQDWPVDEIPSIKWQYYAGEGKWSRLEVLDETLSLTRTGVIEFVFPKDLKKKSKFGKELYWIKAVYQSNLKQTPKAAGTRPVPDQGQTTGTEIDPCPSEVLQIKPTKPYPDTTDLKHIIKGIYLNTTWAVQAETIKDEILGSSNGTQSQTFTLRMAPLISEDIWINEINTISEAEKEELLKEGEFEIIEVKDEKNNLTEFWVKWKSAEDLFESTKNDRHYEIDRFSGGVKFGNGIHGKIPSIGNNNLKATYLKGGGFNGNKQAQEIKELKSSIPYVDKAFNPLEASGGSEIETIENAMERAPQRLKNRNRAITAEDYEQIALQSSGRIARAKCLPNFKSSAKLQPGYVTILVIPQSGENKPKLSLQLKKQIEDYLKEYSASTSNLQVLEPLYLELAIKASIIVNSTDVLPDVENESQKRIKEFLHPITGGFDGKGWEFGRAPCISDFYTLLEKIDGVDYIENLNIMNIKLNDENNDLIFSESNEDVKIPPYSVIYSGKHEVNVNIARGDS